MLETETGELDFNQGLRKINWSFQLETYEAVIHQESVINRHYYQLTSCIVEIEIGEIGFNQSLRAFNQIYLS